MELEATTDGSGRSTSTGSRIDTGGRQELILLILASEGAGPFADTEKGGSVEAEGWHAEPY